MQESSSGPDYKADFDRHVKLYELYRDQIKVEVGLRTSRMTAFLALQGLLFTAIGVTFVTRVENAAIVFFLQIFICGAGIATAVHMVIRNRLMNETMSRITDRYHEAQQKIINTHNGVDPSTREENTRWLRSLPRLHYPSREMKGGNTLETLSFQNILLFVWA
jgi:hypothetical protein